MKKNYFLLFCVLFSFSAFICAQRSFIRDVSFTSSHLEKANESNIELVNNESDDIIADVFAPRRAPAATTYGIMKNSTPQYVNVQKTSTPNRFNIYIKVTNDYSGALKTGFVLMNVDLGAATAIGGSHSFSSSYNNCTETDNWFVQNYKSSTSGTYVDNPYGVIEFTYSGMGSDGYPKYRVHIYNCYGYTSNSGNCINWKNQGVVFEFDQTLSVRAWEADGATTFQLTDDGVNITTNDIVSNIDNTGADAEWKYWLFAGRGIGSDNRQYTFTLKYNAATTLGTFASSLADAEVTSLYQGTTKIEWNTVETTVTEYKTGKYLLTATFMGKNGNKYNVTADYSDPCVTSEEGETQGDVPCTAYFTLDQMSITTQTTLGNALCNANWKTPSGWSKTFTVLQASNSNGASVKLFFSNISTQTYNSVLAPVAREYAFATVDLAQDYDYLASTNCFNPIGNENLYYYGFNLDLNDVYTGQWYDHSNVALGQGGAYIGSNAYFPGGNSDPDYSVVYLYSDDEKRTICPYWSIYTCPDGESYYFNSSCIVHVEQKADGNVLIQVRDKDDASTVYVQIGTTTVEQGGTEGGESTSTPTIKFDTYVNGRGSVTVTPEECFYTEGAQIVLTPEPENGWTFKGWTGACANQITDNHNGTYTYTVPANDCSVIANFEEENSCAYTVHFDSNGGSGTMTDQEFTCGVADNLIPNEFVGPAATITYNYHGATSGDETPSVTVNKPFGVWEDNVVEELHDDEEEINYSVSNGATVTMTAQWDAFPRVTLPTPEKTGHTFNGWYTEETGGTLKGDGGADYVPAGDITLHAQWAANTYTVHFDSNHGEAADEMGDQTFTYDVEQALTANGYEWTGHTFLGWATEEDGDVVYTDQQTVSNLTTENNATVNLYAVWETNSYTITFQDKEADGGHVWWSGNLAYDETPVYGGTEMPTKAGDSQYSYEFAGWKDVDGVEYPTGTDLPAVTAEATYYAVYNQTVLQYTLTWDVNDGDALTGDYTQGDVEWGTAISAPDDPTKEGYQFGGWVSSITNEVEIPSEMPAADLTYTAQWTANTYTVHFDSNHGEAADEMGDQIFTYDVEQALTANGYEWTGHTFQGWATEENGGVVYTDQQTVSNLTAENDATVNLYAVWETNSYTVTFQDKEADGGTEWWSGSFAYGETPVYGGENEPSKESTDEYTYTFTGWTDGVNEYVGTALPEVTDNDVYYAVYSASDVLFTVRFENPDGTELQTYQLPLGSTPAYEGTPVQENEGDAYNYYMFTFTGWVDSNDNSYGTDDALPAVTGDITYTAQYSKQLFIILQEQKDDDYYTEFSEKYNGERATNATLVRQFGQGKWATLCLPFNVPKALMTAVGLQNRVYEFKYTKGDTQSGITLYFALASKMEAGKGYIVNANAALAQKKQLVFYSVLVDTKADIQSGYDISALSGYNSEGNIYLVGTLRRGVLYGDQGNGNYYLGLSNNKIFAANSTTGTNVLAYRGIFRSTEPISAPRVRIVAEGEDGEIVGELEVVNGELEEVTALKKYVQDGILYIERNGIRYSAQGQRLE